MATKSTDPKFITAEDIVEAEKKLTLIDLAKKLRKRAADNASLEHFSGPKSIDAVRVTMLHLADIIEGKSEMTWKLPPVKKRTPDAP